MKVEGVGDQGQEDPIFEDTEVVVLVMHCRLDAFGRLKEAMHRLTTSSAKYSSETNWRDRKCL
ncbi:hypothetical protein AKJ37_04060 [candidate division MSBL1 archaeon SCGC-AAA259I09]|uniref:Uncharacterized protein n=1 Tax=candidate division MSBL1 archaeon SCGC-AAA259I09 TaxID=1698267 RepID=A0A133US00_9EURY|nr:hypothetical protein AKJ37_04060 [candidate division MSBL1 archaeon SCGC-AAA259I09]